MTAFLGTEQARLFLDPVAVGALGRSALVEVIEQPLAKEHAGWHVQGDLTRALSALAYSSMGVSRITLPMKIVLRVLLQQSDTERYGLEIIKEAGLEPGTVYAILLRLRGAGWVTSRWEPAEQAHAEGRPPRKYYRLTALGEGRALQALQRRRPSPNPLTIPLPTTEAGPA